MASEAVRTAGPDSLQVAIGADFVASGYCWRDSSITASFAADGTFILSHAGSCFECARWSLAELGDFGGHATFRSSSS
jgi:hypothetical protein